MSERGEPVVSTVLRFLERINQHDADGLAQLMAPDFLFVDSIGQTVRGREPMRAAWRAYFAFCPDYWVTHDAIFHSGDQVAVFGAAGGTIAVNGDLPPENRWRVSAGWLAVVDDRLVTEWRIYADNKPVYDILARTTPGPRA